MWGAHIARLWHRCHNSKLVIFQEKVLQCHNFLKVQRRHICSPAASFANCVMTLYPLKVHLQTFLSISITKKCQNFELWHLPQLSDLWLTLAVCNCHNRLVPFSPYHHQKNGRDTFFKISWHIKPEMNHVQKSVKVSTEWYANCECWCAAGYVHCDSRRMDHPQRCSRQIWSTVLIKSVGGCHYNLWIHPARYRHSSLFYVANGIFEWTAVLYKCQIPVFAWVLFILSLELKHRALAGMLSLFENICGCKTNHTHVEKQ